MPSGDEQITQIEAAIAAQEALRPVLGEEVTATTVAALRARLAALRAGRGEDDGPARGAATDEAPPDLREGERKQVTVVFADLSEFTALSAGMDPEDVADLADRALRHLSDAVYAYEGYVDKFMGDCVMAVFGAPVAHEDDPERALRAALSMQERLEDFNRHWCAPDGPLALHIGVHTGLVVARSVGPARRPAYTVMGDTVNVASRLRDAAQPGQVLVSRDTQRLTQEAFTFRELAPLVVKGKREPVPAFELQRARLRPGKSRGLPGFSSALVGRERAQAQLRDVFAGLLAGRGCLVTVTGDAGLGKSRLLAEWRAEVADRAHWLEGRAFVHTSAVAYGPFRDLLRQCAGIGEEDSDAQARLRLGAMLERWLPGEEQAPAIFTNLLGMRLEPAAAALLADLPAERLRLRLFTLVEALLARLARERPTVLVLEDIHWADRSSLELAHHLLELTRTAPLAVATTFRPGPGPTPDNLRLLTESGRVAHRTEVILTPLSAQGSRRMVERLLAITDLPPALEAIIIGRAEGNPFFVEEVIRALIDRGALVPSPAGQGWAVTPLIESVTVPDTLQGVLMARLDRLPPQTKWVVQQAAVIGRVFLYRVLLHMSRRADLQSDLGHLEREQLIRERTRDPEIEYVFQHALTQEAAYQSLLAARRREFHHEAGAAMEAVFADRLGEFSGVIAEHFLRGEDWDRAARYFLRAGDAATRMYAHAEARLHYVKALEALARLPDTEGNRRARVDALVKEAGVSFLADGPERKFARLAEAEALVETLPDPSDADRLRLARVRFWMGHALFYGTRLPEATGYFRQARQVAEELGDSDLRAVSASTLGRVVFLQGRFAQAVPLLAEAVGPLERGASWREWVYTVGWHGMALAMCGRPEAGLAEAGRALARATETHYLPGIAAAHLHHAIIHMARWDSPRMREHAVRAVEVAEQAGEAVALYVGLGLRAWASSRLGRHDDARRGMAEMEAAGETIGGRVLTSDWMAAAHGEILLAAGDGAAALARAEAAAANAREIGSLFSEGLAERVWGRALAAVHPSRGAEAAAHLAAGLRAFEAGGTCLEAARTRVAWAALRRQAGDRGGALECLRAAVPAFRDAGLADELARAQDLIREVAAYAGPGEPGPVA